MFRRSYIEGHKNHPHYLSDSKLLILQKNISLSNKDSDLVKIVRNLSDPTKLKIYFLLQRTEEITVTDVSLILNISQSAVSHALTDLKNLGLVECFRCGKLICYSLKKDMKMKKISYVLNIFNL